MSIHWRILSAALDVYELSFGDLYPDTFCRAIV